MFTPRSFGKVGVEAYAAYALRAWLARDQAGSATGPAGSPSGRRSAPSRSAWPGRSPTTCWPRPGRHGHRGPSPPSCPACRSWSWPWGPRWPTCCAPTPTPQRTRPDTRDRRTSHAAGPCLVRRGPGRTGPGPGRRPGHRPGPVRQPGPGRSRRGPRPPAGPARSLRRDRPGAPGRQQAYRSGKAGIPACPAQRGNQGLQPGPERPGTPAQRRAGGRSAPGQP